MISFGLDSNFILSIPELSEENIVLHYSTESTNSFYEKPYFKNSTIICNIHQTTYLKFDDSYVIELVRESKSARYSKNLVFKFLYYQGVIYSHDSEFVRIPSEIRKLVEEFCV